jgi:drug/metabolite transporter (DMT)-like permease
VTHLAAVLGVLVISFSAIFVRLSGVSSDTSAFFRALYAIPVLLVLWLAFGARGRSRKLQALALVSGIFLGFDLAIWHRAIHWIGAGLATVLGNTQVIWVGIAAWVLHSERPRRSVLLGAPLAFAGMILVSGLGRPDAYGEHPLRGTLFGVATGLAYAVFLLLFRRSTSRHETPFTAFLVCTIGTAVATGVVGGVVGELDVSWSWPAHGWLIALALGSQVVGWLLIGYALPRLPAVETSVLLLLQPMATVLWGYLLFSEDLSAVQWLGVALVLSGVALPAFGAAHSSLDSKR